MDIILNPYLTFAGDCRAAMNFYKDILGGTLEISTFESAPMEVPELYKDNVMHANLTAGNLVLMASDALPDREVVKGNSVYLSLAVQTRTEGENIFTRLAEGGDVLQPFDSVFWGGHFGMLKDWFGMLWMVSCP